MVGGFHVDTATVAIGDAACVPLSWEGPEQAGGVWLHRGATGEMAVLITGEDAPAWVEVGVDEAGQVRGARIELVDDVAELTASGDGQWVRVGNVDLGRKVLACDPFSSLDRPHRRALPVPAGRYRVDAFHSDRDLLGIRLTQVVVRGRGGT